MDPSANLASLLARVDALRDEIDAMRPLTDEQAGRAMQRLRMEWTYHSNAIEGNSLTYGETRALLMEGVTAHGKPLKDHLDIERHRDVILYIEDFVNNDEPLRVDFVKEIHLRLMGEEYEIKAETPRGTLVRRMMRGGDYKEHPNNVRTPTGEIHYYAPPLEVPGRMADLMEWLSSGEGEALHPVVRLAVFHHRFVEIHPFPDGNGRTSRVLMNILSMREGYVPAVLRQERRSVYYGALAEAGAGDDEPIVGFVAEELAETMELYLRALRGEPDPESFSRRVALLSRSVDGRAQESFTERELREQAGRDFVLPLILKTRGRIAELSQVVGTHEEAVMVFDSAGGISYGRKAEDMIRKGFWTRTQAQWTISLLKTQPATTKIEYVLDSREASVSLWTRPASVEREYSLPHRLPTGSDADEIVETVMSAALDQIEIAIQKGSGTGSP